MGHRLCVNTVLGERSRKLLLMFLRTFATLPTTCDGQQALWLQSRDIHSRPSKLLPLVGTRRSVRGIAHRLGVKIGRRTTMLSRYIRGSVK